MYRERVPFEDVSAPEREPFVLNETPLHELYKFDAYDWDDPSFKKQQDYAVMQLTQGYFTIVDLEDYSEASRYSWYACVRRDRETRRVTGVYAARNTVIRGKKRKIYLHRFLCNEGAAADVDHVNHMTLDNRRRKNLAPKTHRDNQGNLPSRRREKNPGLPRGVEAVQTREGTRYKAVIMCRGIRRRSVMMYENPQRAHELYRRLHRVLFRGRKGWDSTVHISRPVFPPKMESEPGYDHVSRNPCALEFDHEIPF